MMAWVLVLLLGHGATVDCQVGGCRSVDSITTSATQIPFQNEALCNAALSALPDKSVRWAKCLRVAEDNGGQVPPLYGTTNTPVIQPAWTPTQPFGAPNPVMTCDPDPVRGDLNPGCHWVTVAPIVNEGTMLVQGPTNGAQPIAPPMPRHPKEGQIARFVYTDGKWIETP